MTPPRAPPSFWTRTQQARLVLSLPQTCSGPFSPSPALLQGEWHFETDTWVGGCSLPSEVSVLPVLSAERDIHLVLLTSSDGYFHFKFHMIFFFLSFNFSYLYLFPHVDNYGLSQRSSTGKIHWHLFFQMKTCQLLTTGQSVLFKHILLRKEVHSESERVDSPRRQVESRWHGEGGYRLSACHMVMP